MQGRSFARFQLGGEIFLLTFPLIELSSGQNSLGPHVCYRRKLRSKTSEKSSLIFSGFQWFLIFQKPSALGPPRASNSGRKLKYLKGLEPASPLAFPVRKSVHVRGFCPERIKRRKGPPRGEYFACRPAKERPL